MPIMSALGAKQTSIALVMSAFDPKRTLPKGERPHRIGSFEIDKMAAMGRYELLLGGSWPLGLGRLRVIERLAPGSYNA